MVNLSKVNKVLKTIGNYPRFHMGCLTVIAVMVSAAVIVGVIVLG